MNVFTTEHPLSSKPMSLRAKILTLAALGFLLVGLILGIRHLNGPRIVSRATAPDGTEMCIVQRFNWGAEPFTTSFVYRRPGGAWGRFYFDHQDDYWSSGEVALDTNRGVAIFYRGHAPAVTFDWANERYTLHRLNRTETGAQWKMPAGWNPAISPN